MRKLTIALVAVLVVAAGILPATASSTSHERTDILDQGGSTVAAHNGAKLVRTDDRIAVSFRMRTPRPGSYLYPTADQVPPGASHPPVTEGGHGMPEVFTLWAFVFNYPELCSDGACGSDDIGDTPAKGGIYQLDGRIAKSRILRQNGRIRYGQAPLVGSALENPHGAEVHAAIAPHGKAYTGADLAVQLNGSVGTPDHWFAAVFVPATS